MSLCIHNARLVTSRDERQGGVLVGDDGRIEALLDGNDLAAADVVIDAHGRLLFSGFIDAHVHMRDPGLTHKEDFGTGTTAAACGGVTTVMCMPNTSPPLNDVPAFEAAIAAASGRAFVDFSLQAGLGPDNVTELPGLWARGATSFEAGLSDGAEGERIVRLDDPAVLMEVLGIVASLDAVAGIYTGCQPITSALSARLRAAGRTDSRAHAEARPPVTEAIGIATLIELSRATGVRIVFRQVCTRRGAALVRQAKRELPVGRVGVEVTPHNLLLTLDALDSVGRFGQIIPPLRDERDRRAIVDALVEGTVDFVGSDHAPHTVEEKERDTAWESRNGSPGLDTLAAALLHLSAGRAIPYTRVAEVLGEGPARVFGLADRKGRLAPGLDGDLVIVDPKMERTVSRDRIKSKPGRSVFEGMVLKGWPVLTVLRGEVVAEDGKITGAPHGRFIPRGG